MFRSLIAKRCLKCLTYGELRIDIDLIIAVVSLEFLVRLQDSSPPTQNSEEPFFFIGYEDVAIEQIP